MISLYILWFRLNDSILIECWTNSGRSFHSLPPIYLKLLRHMLKFRSGQVLYRMNPYGGSTGDSKSLSFGVTLDRHFIKKGGAHRSPSHFQRIYCDNGFVEGEPWWRQMETFSPLLAICAENSPVPGEFPAHRRVTRDFDVFFDLRLNKRLSKQSWGWWFETLSCPLWRHCNDMVMAILAGGIYPIHTPITPSVLHWQHIQQDHIRCVARKSRANLGCLHLWSISKFIQNKSSVK